MYDNGNLTVNVGLNNGHCVELYVIHNKISKGAKIRNRYNQVPHLTQDTNGKVTNSQQTPQTRAKRSALSQQVTTKCLVFKIVITLPISPEKKVSPEGTISIIYKDP